MSISVYPPNSKIILKLTFLSFAKGNRASESRYDSAAATGSAFELGLEAKTTLFSICKKKKW